MKTLKQLPDTPMLDGKAVEDERMGNYKPPLIKKNGELAHGSPGNPKAGLKNFRAADLNIVKRRKAAKPTKGDTYQDSPDTGQNLQVDPKEKKQQVYAVQPSGSPPGAKSGKPGSSKLEEIGRGKVQRNPTYPYSRRKTKVESGY